MDTRHDVFSIRIADQIIEIDTVSKRILPLCEKYLVNGEPSIRISVSEKDIQRELSGEGSSFKVYNESITLHDKSKGKTILLNCRNDIALETVTAYRKIVEELIKYNVFLIHGAVIAIGDTAYLFTAPSGTGKTTHIKLWLKNVENSFVVNGDKPLIKLSDDYAYACGTPWCGNESLGTNTIVRLKSIIVLERSEENHIEEISFVQAYPFLLQQIHHPDEPQKAKRTLQLLLQLGDKVSFWRFKCNNYKEDCFDVAYNALVGNTK